MIDQIVSYLINVNGYIDLKINHTLLLSIFEYFLSLVAIVT